MVEIQSVTKAFGKTKALDGVNCRIEKGSIFGLVGSNGAGKSTMFTSHIRSVSSRRRQYLYKRAKCI